MSASGVEPDFARHKKCAPSRTASRHVRHRSGYWPLADLLVSTSNPLTGVERTTLWLKLQDGFKNTRRGL